MIINPYPIKLADNLSNSKLVAIFKTSKVNMNPNKIDRMKKINNERFGLGDLNIYLVTSTVLSIVLSSERGLVEFIISL
jgi:hypothetical protein